MDLFSFQHIVKLNDFAKSKHIIKYSAVAALLCALNIVFLLFSGIGRLADVLICIFAVLGTLFLLAIVMLYAVQRCLKGTAIARAKLYASKTKRFQSDERSTDLNTLIPYAYRSIRLEKKYLRRKPNKDVKKIVLCFHLTPCISSMESIYTAMLEHPSVEPTAVLVPTAQPGMDATMNYSPGLIEYFDKHGYDYKLAYENGKWFNLLELDPDGVFFQTPYALQLPALYNPDLAIAFPKTMYTPYGPWIMDRSVTSYINSGIKEVFFDRLSFFFADKLSLEMLEYAAPQYLPKAVLSGSPKVDFHRIDQCSDAYCWKDPESPRKKILWLPRWGVAEDRTSFMDYYEYFLDMIDENKISFVVRPHPLMFKDLYKSGLFTMTGIGKLKDRFDLPGNSAIDNDCDYREGLLSCDFIVADFTSILYEYLPTGKPIIYTPKDNTLVDSRIIDACYVVRSQDEMKSVFEMLLNGIDPKKEERLEIVKSLEYYPHDHISNGHFITQYVVDNL